jgi:hypothetical protein
VAARPWVRRSTSSRMGAHVPVQRRALGRAVEARTSVAAAPSASGEHERGPRPHHRMGCPPCSVAASGRAGSRWPQRDHHLGKACSAPTGRRFPSCSCRSPHPRPTEAHFASRHRTLPPRLTLGRPQPRGLPRVNRPAGPVSERHITIPPSGETVPELRTRAGSPILTKLACKPFHKRA